VPISLVLELIALVKLLASLQRFVWGELDLNKGAIEQNLPYQLRQQVVHLESGNHLIWKEACVRVLEGFGHVAPKLPIQAALNSSSASLNYL
jgi:hypothetical protein